MNTLYFISMICSIIIWIVSFDIFNNCCNKQDALPIWTTFCLSIVLGLIWPISMCILIIVYIFNTTLKKEYKAFITWISNKIKNN